MARTDASHPVRWLHLSDLHLGCEGRGLWWQVENEFAESVRELVRKEGAPHLILLTGDIANRGKKEEYTSANDFLDALLGWIRAECGEPEPVVLVVPGNHDLVRPEGFAAFPYRVLDRYEAGNDDPDVAQLTKSLWQAKLTDRSKAAREFFDPLFGPYRKWFEKSSALIPHLAPIKLAMGFSPG